MTATSPMSPPETSSVWFLTGSQSLYGPETLAQVEDQSRQIVEQLNAATLRVPVTWQPVVTDAEVESAATAAMIVSFVEPTASAAV